MGKNKSRNRSEERESIGSLTSNVARPAHTRPTYLTQIQDRRLTNLVDPLSYLPALDLVGAVASIGVTDRPQKQSRSRSPKLRFDAPAETLVCIRRHTRKEVLFAKKKTGRGGKSKKHFNAYSKVRCS